MMLDISTNTTPIEKRLAEMIAKISHFKRIDIGAEMSEWQVDDLHRHRPFTMRNRRMGSAATKIRPHSLYEMLQSSGALLSIKEQRAARRAIRKYARYPLPRRRRKYVYRVHRHWSTRPILRQVMEDQLVTRMNELLAEKLKW